jgi:hypothetical protein
MEAVSERCTSVSLLSLILCIFCFLLLAFCFLRQNALSSFHGNKKVIKRKEKKPLKDPVEKYRLRLFIGRKTLKLDLSTKEFWPTRPVSPPPAQQPVSPGRRGSSSSPPASNRRRSQSGSNSPSRTGSISRSRSTGEGEGVPFFLTADVNNENSNQENTESSPSKLLKMDTAAVSTMFADVAHTLKGVSFRGNLFPEEGGRPGTGDSNKGVVEEGKATNNEDDNKSIHSSPSHDDDGLLAIPAKLPLQEEIEFRLNVLPPEILKITGLYFLLFFC